ncbi:hypothetical protein ABBQ32_006069 [Trebouxia sp. C0010 RCD-2024]
MTAFRAWHAASFVLLIYGVECYHSSSFVPEGYAYIGHSSQADALGSVVRKQEALLPASLPVRSTGYTAFLDVETQMREAGQQQRSVDKQHETLMFTREGHLYTKELVLPESVKQRGGAGMPVSPPSMPESRKRSLLQTGNGSALNPTLECEGCPSTDIRVRVADSTQYPWTAIGMVTRTSQSQGQGAINNEVVLCSGTLIGTSHVLTAGHCVVDTNNGEVIQGMQYWPALNNPDEPFQPIAVTRSRVLSIFSNQTAVSTTSLNYDFALLTLQNSAPSGTAELAVVAGVGIQSYDLTTAGYPGDKDFGSMWTTNCSNVQFDFEGASLEVCDDNCDNMVQHSCLTYEGQSGSGMWSGNNQSIHSIVTGAVTLSDGTTQNVGIKLNTFVYNTISTWYNEDSTEQLPLVPAPPSTQAPHRSFNDNAAASWFSNHIWVVVVPAVVGAVILLFLLCCLISCIRRGCGRRKPVVLGPRPGIPQYPPRYPVGPQGTYASQYAQHAQHPQNQQQGPANASPFAQSFYNNGDPSAQGYNRW